MNFSKTKNCRLYRIERNRRLFSRPSEQTVQSQVMFYSSAGAEYDRKEEEVLYPREIIKQNFDPSSKHPMDDIRILLTTDVLAEGINLHRSNVVIIMIYPGTQHEYCNESGRVNRVGTKHTKIHIFNSSLHLNLMNIFGLESNIKTKIQAFHVHLAKMRDI